jgi:D-threo-aldose 1-dehydrogenase
MGAILRRRKRDDDWISSKVGRLLRPVAEVPELDQGFVGALPFARTFDYSAGATVRSIEDSCARMGLSSIDIVYIHDCSEDWHGPEWRKMFGEAMRGAAKVLSAMRKRGEIKGWGMGLNLVEPALACLEQADPDVFLIAGRYTLLDQTGARAAVSGLRGEGCEGGAGRAV